ncbi:MAG: glycerol-3-phosphate 1-O-acyltransferase PlsY [Aliivibrio sp.]|uniref:glycerol-3-phosphate 1-O-acyltransferase PlsY n=1 Tax=Aliivibrio sp. TaxID=1872443 RepID=UPI001A4950A6|nr:glycerol-3-phosphate 1-O-acyltransferase PlsY [Aliivibrio sp.]
MTPLTLIMIICAYLLGSISSAVLICRLKKLPDPRLSGSHNPGATNVFRIGGKGAAALVLLSDILKGMIPVWSGYYLDFNPFILGMLGVSACLGHMYPLFFHFRGGKGVATALGALAPIGLDLTGMLFAAWLTMVIVTGYSSLASMSAALLAPLFTWFIKPQYTIPVAMLSCLIVFRHNENIKRFIEGVEPKIWQKKK